MYVCFFAFFSPAHIGWLTEIPLWPPPTTNPRNPCQGLIWSCDQEAGAGGLWSYDVVSRGWGAATSQLNHSPHHSLRWKVKLEESLLFTPCFSVFSHDAAASHKGSRRRRRRGRGGAGKARMRGMRGMGGHQTYLSVPFSRQQGGTDARVNISAVNTLCPRVVCEECLCSDERHIVGDEQRSDKEKERRGCECAPLPPLLKKRAVCGSSWQEERLDVLCFLILFHITLLFIQHKS